jgi:hypothetical protein
VTPDEWGSIRTHPELILAPRQRKIFKGIRQIGTFFGPEPADCSVRANAGRFAEGVLPWPFKKSKSSIQDVIASGL